MKKKYIAMNNKKAFSALSRLCVGVMMGVFFVFGATEAAAQSHVVVGGNVFGGGNAADVSGNSTVLMQDNATVETDVYGGGALADVGTNNSNATTVNIEGGNVGGNVYGGGLGNAGTAALVNGVVTVNIGKDNGDDTYSGTATIGGSVFGCNNVNGSPRDNVFVNIYKTARTSGVNTVADAGFALSEVFGGGNKAAYLPATTGRKTTVHIYTCDNTIEYVYGGGNAADVGNSTTNSATDVVIDGGRMEWVFGGGNGAGTGNPGANVYGSVTVDYHAGEIAYLFGGSNERGNISGAKNVNLLADGSCTKHINSLYGGSNQADITGDVAITMACSVNECPIDTVFGGSRNANITGDVTLTIEGGTYTEVFAGNNMGGTISGDVTLNLLGGEMINAYGGNNAGGSINGKITVNMLDKGGSCGLAINNIYGGGKNAAYAPTTPGAYPEVNLIHGTVAKKGDGTGGNVYGGGYGATATVTSTPTVNVGYQTSMSSLASTLKGSALTSSTVVVAGNVYGGGDAAAVNDSTAVTLQQVTGGGVTASTTVSGNVYGGGNLADVSGSTDVNVNGGTVSTDVYGGGALADVGTNGSDSTKVTVTGGTIAGGVYGGGLGDNSHEALVKGAVQVTIDGGSVVDVFGCNNVNGRPTSTVRVDINNNVGRNVFGGGNLATYTGDPYVYINKGTVTGNVFGGGNGDPNDATQVKGSVTGTPHVIVGDMTVGHESYQAIVSGDVYGGGNAAKVVTGTPTVEVLAKCNTQIANVYGGGNAADVPATSVTIDGGTISGMVFGGGHGDKDATPTPIAANVAGNTSVTVTGGTINQVFGGSNSNGTIGGTINVTIDRGTGACPMVISEVYGGGNYAASNACNITVGCTGADANEYIDYVYGGANRANITGDIVLDITGGRINHAFGGNNNSGTISGDITVNVEWATPACSDQYLGDVYGGGNLAAHTSDPAVNIKNGTVSGSVFGGGKGATAIVTGNPAVTIGDATASHVAIVTGNVYGGGDAAAVTGNTTVTYNDNNASSTVAKLFGGGNEAGISGGTTVTLTSGKVTSGIYGGCNTNGDVGGNIAVDIEANVGATGAGNSIDIYGGGYGQSTTTGGNVTVTVGNSASPVIYGDIYGGSAFGEVGASGKLAKVDFKAGTLNGTIYGGGKGQNSPSAISATVSGGTEVAVSGGTLSGSIYGGCNERGNVVEDITVNVTGGTLGTSVTAASVFGGGYGSNTSSQGDVTVNINGATATVWGDVYGGSGFGNVNSDGSDATTVNILNGEVKGDVFGGGLGSTSPVYAAAVNGVVTVNIGSDNGDGTYGGSATIGGSVYGCNNANGSPQQEVTVNVYGTAHTAGVNGVADAGYAIANVFGGGKNADYTIAGKVATVNVFGCDNTIGRVFGGGDAAAVTGTSVDLQGGRFNYVFGGGNGEVTAANVGTSGIDLSIHGGTIGTLVSGSNTLGTIGGPINVNVDNVGGCTEEVTDFFGGSNQVDIATDVTTTIECGAGTFTNVYGGSNAANITGNVVLNVKGGTMVNVFGGSKGLAGTPANIDGNVTLNLYGGTVTQDAFGGSNINGNITGTITVNVLDHEGTCALDVNNIYGGGNLTPYTPTNASATSPTVNVMHIGQAEGIRGNVYGGGKGATAIVTAQPRVNIGYVDATMNALATVEYPVGIDRNTQYVAKVAGSVFGGGDAAAVNGSPIVTMDRFNSEVGNLYGGGNEAGITGSTSVTLAGGTVTNGIYGGCNTSGTVTGNSAVSLTGGTVGEVVAPNGMADGYVTGRIFGGGYGESTNIDGNVQVTLNGSTVNGDLYGGSALGKVNTNTSNVNPSTLVNDVNTVTVDILDGTITGNIFGGGLGSTAPAVAATVHGVVHVNIGATDGAGNFSGNAAIRTYALNGSTTAGGSVYGCNNTNGSPQNNVYVDVYKTIMREHDAPSDMSQYRTYAIENLFGGGYAANYAPENGNVNSTKLPYVHVHGCGNTIKEVFGGGNAADAIGTYVTIDGGRYNEIFGGGNGAVVAANIGNGGVQLYTKSGHVGYIFGACNRQGTVFNDNITAVNGGGDCGEVVVDYHFFGGNFADIIGDYTFKTNCSEEVDSYLAIYAGCRLGTVYGNLTLIIEGGNFGSVYGGSLGANDYSADVKKYPTLEQIAEDLERPVGERVYSQEIHDYMADPAHRSKAGTGGNVNVIIKGGYVGSVFGGCDQRGNVEGNITMVIDSCTSCPLVLNSVYGGSNLAQYTPDNPSSTNPYVELRNGTVNYDVFGGGHGREDILSAGLVAANPKVVMGDVSSKLDTSYLRLNNERRWIALEPSDSEDKVLVKGNLYGGGEKGQVTGSTAIDMQSGTIMGSLYGGSKGYASNHESGRVTKNTNVSISGGQVTYNVYGGGELASVGTITDSIKHSNPASSFALSWPYEMVYAANTGIATIDITGGRIGITGKDYMGPDINPATGEPYSDAEKEEMRVDNGDIFGGGKGIVADRYVEAHFANVNNTVININISSDATPENYKTLTKSCVTGALYGGGENGHVNNNTSITLTNGLIGHAVYGAGKGKDTYNNGVADVNSIIAGKVYGNTNITINGGYVVRSIYGGGNLASVGKGNYNGDSYNTTGYGELSTLSADLTAEENSGHTYVTVNAGQIGMLPTNPSRPDDVIKDNIPYGSVFGGSRGQVVEGATDYFGTVNYTHVTIGESSGESAGPTLYGSVYGGAQDGHVRHNTNVVVNRGEIGLVFNDANKTAVGSSDASSLYWVTRGNVYGGGSGIGQYNDGVNDVYNSIAGSVTDKTNVTINGGTIHRNVYGGGSMASVGPAVVGGTPAGSSLTKATVNINAPIGDATSLDNDFGGYVYGSSRGEPSSASPSPYADFATCSHTEVNINSGGRVPRNIYGGGENGQVRGNTSVTLNNGATADQEIYGGGRGSYVPSSYEDEVSGRIMGNTQVNILGGTATGNIFGGCHRSFVYGDAGINIGSTSGTAPDTTVTGSATILGSVYGANNLAGTVMGDIDIDIYSTARTAKQKADYDGVDAEYAIANVFGGGKEADYNPSQASSVAHVHIYTCENTIEDVFGGGDAAAAYGVATHIDGGRFHRVFGGGNGEVTAANIGAGGTNTVINAGSIDQLYGGSNEQGSIAGPVRTTLTHEGACEENVAEFYAGSNEAPIVGNIITTIGCNPLDPVRATRIYGGCNLTNVWGNVTLNIYGGTFDYVFGGSKGTDLIAADIKRYDAEHLPEGATIGEGGNVTLNLYGGTIGSAFGGSDVNGDVEGTITVNIDSINTECPLTISNNVYGGGNLATSNNTSVHLKHGTVGGHLYGAGYGAPATAAGSTSVVVGDGDYTNPIDDPTTDAVDSRVISEKPIVNGSVYGGGELAKVNANSSVSMLDGLVKGSLFGAGLGTDDDVDDGLVKGNSAVTMSGGTILQSLYGGGEMASVGTYSRRDAAYHSSNPEVPTGYPYALTPGTGHAEVTVSGGTIGPAQLAMPDFTGMVFGGGKGVVSDTTLDNNHIAALNYVGSATVTISGTAFVKGSVYGGAESGRVFDSTCVRIQGGQIGAGTGAYDNVTHKYNLLAPYSESQFEVPFYAAMVAPTEATSADPTLEDDPEHDGWRKVKAAPTPVTNVNALAGCPRWTYESPYAPYDPVTNPMATDGHTYYGNVFAGGSGVASYPGRNVADDADSSIYIRTAGRVRGTSRLEINGGHILTSAYGGCEMADVVGTATVVMSGGTIGVPRTDVQIKAHPVICNLFGGGKGDQRTDFNTWTFVSDAAVTVRGGWIYGSVFGGGEDGHVGDKNPDTGGDIVVNIQNPATPAANPVAADAIAGRATWIGTWGTTYVDGNVFGSGRGFGGTAQTAGSNGGNVTVNISGGQALGSVYGGGRLASVGTVFVSPDDPTYGKIKDDITSGPGQRTFGVIHVNISGGIIGNGRFRANPVEDTWVHHNISGNVYGGSMGRFEIDNQLWPMLGKSKRAFVTISGDAQIQGSVYGGGEIGCVLENAYVNIQGGLISGNVFGGGYGSNDMRLHANVYNGGDATQGPTAAALAGRVQGNTFVTITGGTVTENVYGGGDIASVGVITDSVKHVAHGTGANAGKFTDNFGLSWPYEMTYGTEAGTDIRRDTTGHSHVYVYGGRIGWSGKDSLWGVGVDDEGKPLRIDNGDIFGAGKGMAQERYAEAHIANVQSATVVINYAHPTLSDPGYTLPTHKNSKDIAVHYTDPLIAGAVYGGGENGHVVGDAKVTLEQGWIGHNIYGGGKGKGIFKVTLDSFDPETGEPTGSTREADVYGVISGRVFGNTDVTMNGGHVVRSIYGGGNQGCVGVGNYAGGGSDYSKVGYGECVDGDNRGSNADHGVNFWSDTVGHGTATVRIYGGIVGVPTEDKDDLPTGNVFGGCRGESVPNVPSYLSPRWLYVPEYYLGYVNNTYVIIGKDTAATPVIYGSVYGGAQDGHVRDVSRVVINKGTIGLEPTSENRALYVDKNTGDPLPLSDMHWVHRGNVYGGGSGIGLYDSDDDGVVDTYSRNSGSVTQRAMVTVNGGTIYRNVYGGGSLSMVGPPKIQQADDCPVDSTYTQVDILGGTIGTTSAVEQGYGGNVFGASRGQVDVDNATFSTVLYTKVNVGQVSEPTRPNIRGNVYGGGEVGTVKYDTWVSVSGGLVGPPTGTPAEGYGDGNGMNAHVYGGGKGIGDDADEDYKTFTNVKNTHVAISGGQVCGSVFGGAEDGHVTENTNVTVTGGIIGSGGYTHEYDGCVLGGGRNDLNVNHSAGRVGGHTNVTVTGGRIQRSVFGGGAMARVGVDVDGLLTSFISEGVYDSINHGSSFVSVSGDSVVYANQAAYEASAHHPVYDGTTRTDASGKVIVYLTTIGCPSGSTLVDNDYTIGDIFGGGKGDTKDTVDIMAGRVMNTNVVVSGAPRVMADIYAGGEMSCIGWYDTTGANTGKYYNKTGYTHVTISDNPYTGTPYEFSTENYIDNRRAWTLVDSLGRLTHTCSGNVYGGGQGYVEESATHRHNWVQMGRVRKTEVVINGGRFMGNVFGGGSRGIVKEDCHVTITGGTIGCIIHDASTDDTGAYIYHDQQYFYGSVFGGGYGNPKSFLHNNDSCFVSGTGDTLPMRPTEYAGRVDGNTYVTITGGHIMDCVYGGGDMASTGWVERDPSDGHFLFDNPAKRHGGVCTVKISGNTVVGPLDYYGHNAYVYGAGRGVGYDPDEHNKYYCNVNETHLLVNLTSTGAATLTPAEWDPATHGGRIWGSLFGGGADCHVLGDVNTHLKSGLVGTRGITSYDGNIFGGGRNYFNTNHTNGRVQGNIDVLMDGGALQGTVFGGGRMALSGIDADGHFPTTSWDPSQHGNVTITVRGNAVVGTSTSVDLLTCDESCGDIFGAGKGDTKNYEDIWAGRVTNTVITIKDSLGQSPRIHGGIFGGGEMASIGYWDDTIQNDEGTVIFHTDGTGGTDYGTFYTGTGTALVTISGNVLVGTAYEYTVNPADNPGDWTIYNETQDTLLHTCTGNVYGGCQGDVDVEAPRWVSMGRSASAVVNISGGRFMSNVFGGGEQGIVTGDTRVNISGGTFGIDALTGLDAVTAHVSLAKYYSGDIYAAGFGCENPAEYDDVTPNDSTAGRMALGVGWTPGLLAGRTFGDSRVDITGGHIAGSVYGGGSFASVGFNNGSDDYHGDTYVNIGTQDQIDAVEAALPSDDGTHDDSLMAHNDALAAAYADGPTIEGSVYGANNFSGTPHGAVTVNIYHTAHNSTNEFMADAGSSTGTAREAYFALRNVFGGGNRADYEAGEKISTVNVFSCYNTIECLYGGGNAAAVPATMVTIQGGRLDTIFGGGNGTRIAAHVGYLSTNTVNPGDPIPGDGSTTTTILGGDINYLFSGSNMQGSIRGASNLISTPGGGCYFNVNNAYGGGNEGVGGGGTIVLGCGTNFGNFYAGANNADLGSQALWDAGTPSDVNLIITGGHYENVFGGNNQSGTLYGNVNVTITGGHIENLFGGNNLGGNILGTITVNVDIDPDDVCGDGLLLNNVYGGGNMAVYRPANPNAVSPIVNIINDTITFNVYGGGLGDGTLHAGGMPGDPAAGTLYKGAVYANPWVNVGGLDYNFHDAANNDFTLDAAPNGRENRVRIHQDVFGGGSSAPVYGNPTVVLYSEHPKTTPGNLDHDTTHILGSVFGGGYGPTAIVHGNTAVGIFGNATVIENDVYGGGNAAKLYGGTDVQIGYEARFQVAMPIASVEPKNSTDYDTINLYCATPGATVFFTFTTDDSNPVDPDTVAGHYTVLPAPDANGRIPVQTLTAGTTYCVPQGKAYGLTYRTYQVPITPNASIETRVKAIAIRDGYEPSFIGRNKKIE